jgi:hypothetical protein
MQICECHEISADRRRAGDLDDHRVSSLRLRSTRRRAVCGPSPHPRSSCRPYTASDQSASAGMPAGWKVAGAAQTNIQIVRATRRGHRPWRRNLSRTTVLFNWDRRDPTAPICRCRTRQSLLTSSRWFLSSVPRSTDIRFLRLSSFTRRLFNRYRLGSNAACLLIAVSGIRHAGRCHGHILLAPRRPPPVL